MIVSRRRDTLYSLDIPIFKKTKNYFCSKNNLKLFFLDRIHSELQGPKESRSARYFFLCLKLASNEVSHRRDSITHT